MVRLWFGLSLRSLVCACVAAGCLTGCASNRNLSRSLRLSAVETSGRLASKSEPRDESVDPEDRSARVADEPEADSAVLATSAEFIDELPPGKEDIASPSRRVRLRGDVRRESRLEDLKPAARTDEILEVLLTGYRERFDADAEETKSDTSAETPVPVIRFQVPAEFPGSEAPPLRVPPSDPQQSFAERKEIMSQLYGRVPPLPLFPDEQPDAPTWALDELEQIAWENHPALMQAAAQMEVARGGMIQAGLHPNPTVGWEQDTIANGIQGYQGPFWNQTIVTGGKLKLARCAAGMDYENAKIEYQRMRIEIATRVRTAYYDLVVSQQRRRMLSALARLTDEIYEAQVELVAGGQAAAYEPLQVRVFAVQARNAVIDAHNGVVAAGRRVGAATGMAEVETFHVTTGAESIPARIDFHTANAYLLENHTELRTARNRVVQSQFLSRLEYIRPRIPDLTYYQTVQHAYNVGPYVNSYNMQIGAPIPIFDRNQGNILATQSSIVSHERSFAAAQNNLTGQLAGIVARFETSRAKADNYRRQMLPDQVRTYRGIYSRYREAGPGANDEINFGDVIVAQQTLGSLVNDYAGVLTEMWKSYIDAAELLQAEDLHTLDAWFGAAN